MLSWAVSFIPDKVLYSIINGQENSQDGKQQREKRELPSDQLIQLYSSIYPCQDNGNHLECEAGIPAIII
jgi:hypothetical protein